MLQVVALAHRMEQVAPGAQVDVHVLASDAVPEQLTEQRELAAHVALQVVEPTQFAWQGAALEHVGLHVVAAAHSNRQLVVGPVAH